MRNGIMAVFLAAAVATVSPWAIANDDITEDRMIKRMEFEIALQRLSKKVYTKADETAWAAAKKTSLYAEYQELFERAQSSLGKSHKLRLQGCPYDGTRRDESICVQSEKYLNEYFRLLQESDVALWHVKQLVAKYRAQLYKTKMSRNSRR